MNSIFSFNRWIALIKIHLAENSRKYLLGSLAIAGILIGWYGFLMLVNKTTPLMEFMQFSTYFGGLFIGGCLFASLLFNDLSNRPKAINYLLLPASHLEKLLCALLFGVIIYFVLYSGIFSVVNYMMVNLQDAILNSSNPQAVKTPTKIYTLFSGIESEPDIKEASVLMLSLYLGLQAAFILGSVYFRRYTFVKTVISLIVVGTIFAIYIAKVIVPTMPANANYTSFTGMRITGDGNVFTMVALPEWINTIISSALKYAVAPIFYLITYFRLREKEA